MAKVMISVPEEFLETVDRAAAEAGQSRSAFVRDALRRRLADDHEQRRVDLRKQMRQLARGRTLWAEAPELVIRRERDR
jgi:metal-responsive CopG/Arc/MetJ family transcriptional regulator